EVAHVRGESDAIALKLRHHDRKVHQRRLPQGQTARAIYEAVEQARCEAIGSRRMAGVSENLTAALSDRYRRKRFERSSEKSDRTLVEVMRLLTREVLTGAQPPQAAKNVVELWRPWIESRCKDDFKDLVRAIEDQENFQRVTRRLIEDLDLEGAEDSETS